MNRGPNRRSRQHAHAVEDAAPASDAGVDAPERPSKTQRKGEMAALQALGTRLVGLSAAQLDRLALPEPLDEAVREAQRITAHEARRRQLQFIGKLMRQVDPAPITQALEAMGGESRAAVALTHRSERWRDRLLDDDDALTSLLAESQSGGRAVDVQALRALIRAARRERTAAAPPRHARELYRRLHELLSAPVD